MLGGLRPIQTDGLFEVKPFLQNDFRQVKSDLVQYKLSLRKACTLQLTRNRGLVVDTTNSEVLTRCGLLR